MPQRIAIYTRSTGTSGELGQDLRQKVEARGGFVVGVFAGCRGRQSGWNRLMAGLDGLDQIALASAGDIPGKTVRDLLRLLGTLRDHGVGLLLLAEGIDTSHGSAFTLLAIIEAFQRAKLSQAIRNGQAKAVAAGKVIGRPVVPANVRRRIEASLASGIGIRPTARKFGVSAATVVSFRRSVAQIDAEAA
jgi:DNA invertase Pin-like site-specific DNA recombinase